MEVRCEGGSLHGIIINQPTPKEVIHQNGMLVLKVHQPYPKRKGEKVVEKLLSWTEEYRLEVTEAGPVYRCVAPWEGVVMLGTGLVVPSEGGAYHVYADRAGKLHPRPVEEGV